jgi:hypothetical protein
MALLVRLRLTLGLATGLLAVLSLGVAPAAAATAEAYSGEPFGVGRISVSVGGAGPVLPLEDERFTVKSADGRALYPVLKEDRPARRLLRELLDIERPRSATIYFLFRGAAPFDMQAYAPSGQAVRVTPLADAAGHARLLREWWEQYVNRWQDLQQDPQFPPVIENFIVANMSRRLGLEVPPPRSGLLAMFAPKKAAWDDLMITERHQLALDQDLVRGTEQPGAPAGAAGALPPPMPWYDLDPPTDELKAVAVEPMAAHVPVECFYVRYGTFTNYLWFRDLNRKWQGDLGNMIIRRGIDRAAADRIEQQLGLRETALSKIVGPQVISDVALIGLDPHVNQGAAIGMLFQARVNQLLNRDLIEKRQEALAKFPDATETTVKIGERDVSLISTPGGEVRSYYVVDGDYHLVATSRRLIQRFLEVGAGERALAASAGFLQARQRLAHDRGDAVFAYISPEFFRELTSPATWIESQRRARSQREAKVIELARLEAVAEGVAATTVEELVVAGVLPGGFGTRGDGSSLAFDDAGVTDSQRGRFGFYVPGPDLETTSATAVESAAYTRFADRFRQEVGQTPPIAVGIQREPLADGSGETISADVLLTPLEGLKLGRLPDILGEPSTERVTQADGDVVRAEVVLDEPPLPLLGGNDEPHHLFVGLRDFRSPLVVERGRLAPGARRAELVRMYVGSWPKAGMLAMFSGPEVADGVEPVPAGEDGWQARRDEFLVMSFKPDLVNEVLPQLAMQEAERPAQVWINVDDLTGKDLASTVSALGYSRARQTSVSACRLMNTLANQLHVPRDQCRAVAEGLVDGTFVCSLGGEYQLVEEAGGLPTWTSTAIAPQNRFLLTAPPADYELPALTWFKGLRGDLRLEDAELAAHVEIDMAKSAVP